MRFTRNIIISLLVLAFILFGTITISNAQTAIFTPDTLYMGKIPVSSKAVRNLIIYNIHVNDLDISSIQTNNASFSILNNPGTATLGIAEQIVLNIEFSPSSVGHFDGQISVQSNTNNGATTIQVTGEGLSNTNTYFERIFGPAEGGSLSSFKETPDGGYMLVGKTENPDEEVNDINIVKTDRYGEKEWRNVIEDEDNSEQAKAIIITNNGNYMVFGERSEDANDDPDFLLYKLDQNGNVLWSKIYGGNKDDKPASFVETSDGYLLVGYSDSFGDGSSKDIYIVKVDQNGNEQWHKTYGGSGGESASEVINTNDGGFAIIGKTDSKGAGDQDIWLLKINADGDLQWD